MPVLLPAEKPPFTGDSISRQISVARFLSIQFLIKVTESSPDALSTITVTQWFSFASDRKDRRHPSVSSGVL